MVCQLSIMYICHGSTYLGKKQLCNYKRNLALSYRLILLTAVPCKALESIWLTLNVASAGSFLGKPR